jgi:hypothetical protein
LHDMLRSHASFAMTRTHHWTLGSIRPALAA